MSCGQLVMFLLRNESELLAFLMVDCVCIFHERLFAKLTPRYFPLLTD